MDIDLMTKKFNLSHPLEEKVVVSIYGIAQCYGGPEEGGWWYDHLRLEAYRICKTEEEARETKRQMREFVDQKNEEYKANKYRHYEALPDPDEYPDPSCNEGYIPTGWSDGEEFEIITENYPGENETQGRPVYE